MSDKKIKEFVVEDNITGYFIVRTKQVREYTRGQYVQMELGDNSGRIQSNMWDADTFALNDLEAGMIVKVRGIVGEYRNKLQFTIEQMRLALDDEYDIAEILPHSIYTYDQRKARIVSLTEKIENSYIKTLVQSFWDDEQFFDKFLNAAAGKLWHHNYIGGLSEHSANLAELALRVSVGYEFIDKDMMIFGGLFHDIGKIDTYTSEMVINYTDKGRLVGHICIADHWIAERASQIENFPEDLLTKLRHIILSHQGKLEFATPVVPMMPEAFIIYYCDEIDSKMGAIDRIRERHDGQGWSDWVNLLGRHLFFGNESSSTDET